MTISTWVLLAWKEKITDHRNRVDPFTEHDWYSIALGFCIGLGLKPNEAHITANHIIKSGMI